MGAKDCAETLRFNKAFPVADIYCFECNQETLPLCRKSVAGNIKLHLTEKAVSDEDGTITFYPIDTDKTGTIHKDGNPGASSIFQASGKYSIENYVQKETKVPATRLDTFMEEKNLGGIDILWLDAQGAELKILKGLGKKLRTVRLINTEVEFTEIYKGQPMYRDIRDFLTENGFEFYGFTYKGAHFADAIFVNKDLVPKRFGIRPKIIRVRLRDFYRKWSGRISRRLKLKAA